MSNDHVFHQSSPQNMKEKDSTEAVVVESPADDYGEWCGTPTSRRHKIPTIQSCPPAPRKQAAKVLLHKRKLPKLQFFEIIGGEEVDSFFQSFVELSSTVASRPLKKRHMNQ
uniref:Putative cyclin-dependent protein kinase inhibitor SMR2 n=1 Tax=Davidia involucrata TaxID=16924 RepID=A0A5B7BFS7_DAVIN